MLFLITKSAKILQNVLFVDRNVKYKQILLIVRSLLHLDFPRVFFVIPRFLAQYLLLLFLSDRQNDVGIVPSLFLLAT